MGVEKFPGKTKNDMPVDQVIADISDPVPPETLLWIGLNSDGDLVSGSSVGDEAILVWLVELWKHKLLQGELDQ